MDGITTSINSILKNLLKKFNTLLDCPVRYAGEYNGQKVHNFIEYIESYKRIKCITDEQALEELQFLLIDQAHAWWLRRISHLKTWSEALTSLENHYSKQRPPHVIYKDVFKHNYDDYNNKEDFIDDKNELLAELTQPKLSEKNKLEVIYALLPNDVHTKIKFENIIDLKDLKEQLQKLKCTEVVIENLSEQQNTIVNTNNTEVVFSETASNEENNSNLDTNERDPIIKVRRTEDLMPHIKDEDVQIIAQQDEFVANDEQSTNNNASPNNNEHFQIDSDLMNQINNIIDESEMNALHNNSAKKPSESQQKSSQATKKNRIRCSYCRRFNHTSKACLKKAKQMKQLPEKLMPSKVSGNEVVVEPLTSNINIDTSAASTEPSVNTPSALTTMISVLTPSASTTPSVPTVSSSFNNISDKSISSTLTTKLIAPINGPVPNKIMAAKLRNSNGHMPKCHQCGTVGFYKSICPNCSPIYNNNQYK